MCDKWAPNVSPQSRTIDVGRETLRGRLAEVFHYLRRAARKPDEDIEYVHQLRVWARRASAATTLYRELLPSRLASRLEK